MRLATRSPAPLFGCDAATCTHKSRRGGRADATGATIWRPGRRGGLQAPWPGLLEGGQARSGPGLPVSLGGPGGRWARLQVAASEVPPAAIMMARPANTRAACGGRARARGAGPPGARGARPLVGPGSAGVGVGGGNYRRAGSSESGGLTGASGCRTGPAGLMAGRRGQAQAPTGALHPTGLAGPPAESAQCARSQIRPLQVPQCAGVRQCGAGSAAAALRLHSAACHCGSCSFPTTTAQLTNRNVLQVASAGLSSEERRQMQRPTHMPAKRRPARGQAADSKLSFDGSKLQLAQ